MIYNVISRELATARWVQGVSSSGMIIGLFRLYIRSLLSLHHVEVKDIVMTYYVFLFVINNIFKIFSLSGLAQPKSAR